VIPPTQNGEFVARMEDVLDTYCLPHDPQIRLIGMDEQPVQLQDFRLEFLVQAG
jgi:hypothetical protein